MFLSVFEFLMNKMSSVLYMLQENTDKHSIATQVLYVHITVLHVSLELAMINTFSVGEVTIKRKVTEAPHKVHLMFTSSTSLCQTG